MSTYLSSASVLVKVSQRAVFVSNCNLRLFISEFHNQHVRQIHLFYQKKSNFCFKLYLKIVYLEFKNTCTSNASILVKASDGAFF